jgi:hypothetical protein
MHPTMSILVGVITLNINWAKNVIEVLQDISLIGPKI